MIAQGWREIVVKSVRDADAGDPSTLDLLAEHLAEIQQARQALRDKGYGVTGTPIQEQVAEVPIGWLA